MLPLIRRPIGPRGRHRGVTLVEMLVVVALVVLMMVILVQIFQVATGAMSASRTIQELDVNLRQIDSIIRTDLAGVTAKMTPPNNPLDKTGYFEYIENAPADVQGEDSDDILAFTTRAPDGQFFTGRQWLGRVGSTPYINQSVQPTTITSQVAEVVYFLRNGNLYRRVFLVVPDRAKSIQVASGNPANANATTTPGIFYTSLFGQQVTVSWLGVNDISARPGGSLSNVPIPNDLGDLTRRENRRFSPRFNNDFTNNLGTGNPDGVPDDNNVDSNGNVTGDGVPDYYPTIYTDGTAKHGYEPNVFMNEANSGNLFPPHRLSPGSHSYYAFPFIYPGMYSVADPNRLGYGWVHYLYPNSDSYYGTVNNHNALGVGDNLAAPSANQTWWGFPTWRETMSTYVSATLPGWRDPIDSIGQNLTQQPLGLIPFPPATQISATNNTNLLPPVGTFPTTSVPAYADLTAGSSNFVPAAGGRVWEDDLLLTNVRSFDVKAYDTNAPLYNTTANGYFSAGYQDLGYGANSYAAGVPNINDGTNNGINYQFQIYGKDPVGFGHEGRMPPIVNDFRPHPTRGYNVGDDSTGVTRLTRTWDSWSTDYTNPPETDIYLNQYTTVVPTTLRTIYPAFPAPYPTPLRGIQVQIRLADPRNEKVKSLTIRVDFTDKL